MPRYLVIRIKDRIEPAHRVSIKLTGILHGEDMGRVTAWDEPERVYKAGQRGEARTKKELAALLKSGEWAMA